MFAGKASTKKIWNWNENCAWKIQNENENIQKLIIEQTKGCLKILKYKTVLKQL